MLVQGVHAGPQAEVEHHVAVLHEQVVVAGAAVGDRGPSGAFRHPAQHAVVAVSPADTGSCRAERDQSGVPRQHQLTARSQVPGRRRLPGSTGTNRTVSPGRSWPSFQRSAVTTVTGQTKPPRLGPSGPSRIGVSPVKSRAPTE